MSTAPRKVTMEQTNASGKKVPSYPHAMKQKKEKDDTSDHEDEVRSELSADDEDQVRKLPTRKPTRPGTTKPGESTGTDKSQEKEKTKDSSISEPLSYLLLKPAYDAGKSTVVHDDAATFIPCAHMLFAILNAMHLCTSENIYVYRANSKYHVILSRLYYAVLFYIQILRCKRVANIATNKEKRFLTVFEEDYPFESLPIAGPLVTHFNTLTAFKHDDPMYKWISPTVVYDQADARLHKLPVIPYLLGMIAQLKKKPTDRTTDRDTRDASTNPHIDDSDQWTPFYIHDGTPTATHTFGGVPFTARVEIAGHWAGSLVRPGMAYPLEPMAETLENRRAHLRRMKFPDPVWDPTSIANWLHMDESMEWFRNCVSAATTECAFFLGSANLSQINVTGTPSTLVMTTSEPLSYVPDHFEWFVGPTSLKVTAKTQYGAISPDDFAIGMFNTFHLTYPSNAPWGLENLGSTRPRNAGDYHPWYTEPTREESGKAKLVSSELETVIRLKMFIAKGSENRKKD